MGPPGPAGHSPNPAPGGRRKELITDEETDSRENGTKPLASEWAQFVRGARLRAGISQGDLARRLSMHQTVVSRLERTGAQKRPPRPLVVSLGQALDLEDGELEELLRLAGYPVRGVARIPESVADFAPSSRRFLFWTLSGLVLAAGLLAFGSSDLISAVLFGVHPTNLVLVLTIGFIVVLSPAIGFLLHQAYFALYWSRWLPLGSSPPDRAYPLLLEVERRFGRDVLPQGLWIAAQGGIDGRYLLVGTEGDSVWQSPYRPSLRGDPEVPQKALNNWRVLNRLWWETLARTNMLSLQGVVGPKEDLFTLLGVCIGTIFFGFFLYAVLEFQAVAQREASVEIAALRLSIGGLALICLFWILRRTRYHVAMDAMDTRFTLLLALLERVQSQHPGSEKAAASADQGPRPWLRRVRRKTD